MRLRDAALLDDLFAGAGLFPVVGHGALGELSFELGSVASDDDSSTAWMSVLISSLATLQELEAAGDATVRARAKAALETRATVRGYVRGGALRCPGTFRAFRVAKSAGTGESQVLRFLFGDAAAELCVSCFES